MVLQGYAIFATSVQSGAAQCRPIPPMPPTVPSSSPAAHAATQAVHRGRQMLSSPLSPTSWAAKYVNSIQEGTIHEVFHMEA